MFSLTLWMTTCKSALSSLVTQPIRSARSSSFSESNFLNSQGRLLAYAEGESLRRMLTVA